MKVGFVGLGAMGVPMALALAEAGHSVNGTDVSEAAMARFGAAGGRTATLEEATEGADALVLMVVNAGQARAVLIDGGALCASAEGAVVLLMATCPPAQVEQLAQEVEASGRVLLDCPVSGGVAGAEARSLTIMAGGPQPAFARAKPLLDAMGGKVVHIGERPGQGAAMKTINQLLCGVHIAAAAEAMTLAGALGVDRQVALDILSGSAASSWMLKDRGPRMLEAEPQVKSAVDIFVKDLGIVTAAGEEAKLALPLAAAALQMFLGASGAGDGAADDSQVRRAYERLSGRPALR